VQDPNPALSIAVQNDHAVLTWPEAADGFELMITSDLSSSLNWVPVGLTPMIIGDQQSLIVPLTETSQYYQLRKLTK
jgi:hypothetical protein